MTQIFMEIPGHKPSGIYPHTKKQVVDLNRKYQKILVKWRFLHSGELIKIPQYDGTFISYRGIKFSGSAELVFWKGFIEPYLQNDPLEILRNVAELSQKANQNLIYCLDECEQLLGYLIHNTYEYMAETAQLLKSDGGIKKAPKKNVSSKISTMKQYIADHRKVIELEFNNPKASKPQESILDIKPNFYGIGFNLNALWKKITWWRQN